MRKRQPTSKLFHKLVDTMNSQIDLLDQSESLEKGFQLARFIAHDRATAVKILSGALEKLSVQYRCERRRFYWRYNHAHHPIRRITRPELDAFQWLIMLESEPYEKEQEQRGSHSLREMVVRYIKHLVQTTMYMSPFYVCVGMNRLLYSYSTSDTQAAFEIVTQRFPGADQYRRAKKMLTSRLRERFGDLIETIRTSMGEIRFKALEDQSRWNALVDECLSIFSPWSTESWCERFRPRMDSMPCSCAWAVKRETGQADAQEMIYCHMFIEPVCREKLSTFLFSSSPQTTLCLPNFTVKRETDGDDSSDLPGTSKLSSEEKTLIAARLSSSYVRRRRIRPGWVCIFVDGLERSRLNLTGSSQLHIGLVEGARLVEVRGVDDGGELVLGAYLISYAEEVFELSKVQMSVNNGQLDVTVSPVPRCGEQARAVLTATFRPNWQPSWGALADLSRPFIGFNYLAGPRQCGCPRLCCH